MSLATAAISPIPTLPTTTGSTTATGRSILSTHHKTGYCTGQANEQTTLTPKQVIEIFLSPLKADYLASLHNTSRTTVYRIKKRQSWGHLTKDLQSVTKRINSVGPKDVKRR